MTGTMDVSILHPDGILRYVTVAIIIGCTIWILARRRYHLRSPPGPPGWPTIGHIPVLLKIPTCTTDDYRFSQWSRQYGDIYKIKLGPSLVYVLSNMDHVREVFGHSKILGRPPAWGYKVAFGPEAKGIASSSGSEWMVLRRFTLTLFRDLGVGRGRFAETINLEITRLAAAMDSSTQETCWNVVELFNTAIGNITCGFVFGHQYDYGDEEFKKIADIMHKFGKALGPSASVFASKFLCKLPFGPGKKLINVLNEFKTYLQIRIRETKSELESENSPNTFVKAFLQEMGKGETSFCEGNLITCCLEMFFAGTETTANILAFAILLLTTHPAVQRKCQEELADFVKKNGGMPSYSDRSRLPYLQAMMMESERVASVVPLGLAHVVEEDDVKLFGYDFPKGTLVTGNFDYMNMDEKKFPQPYEFRPERFLQDGHFEAHPDILPFSIGRRSCPGEPLARMEIFLILTNVLHRFTLSAPADTDMPDYRTGVYGDTRSPLPFAVDVRRRENWSLARGRRGRKL